MAGAIRMNICNDNHTEICYDSYNCPMCELLADLAQLRTEYEQLEQELNSLEEDLNECAKVCATYRSILADIAPEHLL